MEVGRETADGGVRQGSVEPTSSGASPQKRGETPRQQIHRAKKAARRRFSAEDKIRVAMEGIRGEEPVSVLCRREGLHTTVR